LKVPLPIGTFASSVRELRVQVVVPVLPKLVAGAVALFAVLFVVVLTKSPPEEELARPDVLTLDPELVAELGRLDDEVSQAGDAREATLYTRTSS
jgi:hypothetical protein